MHEGSQVMKYLACIAVKHTREQITEVELVEANSPYDLPGILKESTGVQVDGLTNYVDWVPVDGTDEG